MRKRNDVFIQRQYVVSLKELSQDEIAAYVMLQSWHQDQIMSCSWVKVVRG
jgi:hypothetical protein